MKYARTLSLLVLPVLFAWPVAAQLVISQVYGGGGATTGSPAYRTDYIEIFNRGSALVTLTGYSVQYGSATGTGAWQATNLSGAINPNSYVLVSEGGGTYGPVLPITADVTGTISMSASSGKVALVNGTTALSGCPASGFVDMVGYGSTANCSEGAPTATLDNTKAAIRNGGGCADTGNNASDFTAATSPVPRNSASAPNPCVTLPPTITNPSVLPGAVLGILYSATFTATGGSGTGYSFSVIAGALPPGLTLTGSVLGGTPTSLTGSPFSFTLQVTDSAGATGTKDFTLAVTLAPVCNVTNTIGQIQGSGATSPLTGAAITTSGIVTGQKSNGFFLQMPPPGDGDPNTSDGVFVYVTGGPPGAAATGNSVCVSGTVQEYIPSADPSSPPITEIGGTVTVTALASGQPLPPPAVLAAADTNPAGGLDALEEYEGMRVQVDSLTVVAPTDGSVSEANATSTSNGIFFGVITGVARPFREPGVQLPDALPTGAPCCVPRWDANPERLRIDTKSQPGVVPLNVASGAVVGGLVGPLDYQYRTYGIVLDASATPVVTGNASFTAVPAASSDQFTIAAFNFERFYDTVNDPGVSDVVLTASAFSNRLNKASLAIRSVLNMPDILGVEEVENLATLQAIAGKVTADALAAQPPQPDPAYQACLVSGNDIGGINVGFLVKSMRASLIDCAQYGKTDTYIDPNTNLPATLNDRPPLALRAAIAPRPGSALGIPVTVIVNHLKALSGVDDPVDGARVRMKREKQAENLASLIQARQTANPFENIVSVGDYNAFEFNDGYVDVMGVIKGSPAPANEVVVAPPADLVNTGLTDLADNVLQANRYSYLQNGSAQVLDHILVNGRLLPRLAGFEYGRNGADFPETYRNDPNRPERLSDHDPAVAYFTLPVNQDVSGQVRVTRSGLLFSRVTNTYTGTITVTNTDAQPVAAPLRVVLADLPSNVTLVNAAGESTQGPYLTVLASGNLASGQSATVQVRLKKSAAAPPISYSTKAYSGDL